jgi:uncharacterized membrane protein/nitrite reductase/ring-hydroxylating ferredoxin subunit
MKSKVHFKSHPLHPILVAFPIAFFIGTFLFDCLGLVFDNESFTLTGRYLNIAAVISAAVAAVPGFVDYIYTVPPESSASKRGAKHGIINTIVLSIFVFIILYRKNPEHAPMIRMTLELIGVVLLTIAGWLGGTLVHRNQIGVDIRYADAGKWKEEYLTDTNGIVKAGTTDDLSLNQMKLIHVKDKRIVLARTEDGYVAFDDHCTHRGGSLAGGALICGTVQCPWHGSQFDVKTGALKAGPATENIRTYNCYESGKDVIVELGA